MKAVIGLFSEMNILSQWIKILIFLIVIPTPLQRVTYDIVVTILSHICTANIFLYTLCIVEHLLSKKENKLINESARSSQRMQTPPHLGPWVVKRELWWENGC